MRNFTATVLLLLAVALIHHPVLWIDHVLWDEVSFYKMAGEHDLTGKLESLVEQGVATGYNLYALFAGFSNPTLALRWAVFVSIWIISVVIFSTMRRFYGLATRQAFAAALVAVAYPSYQMYANAGAAIYVICAALFFVGFWCYLQGMSHDSGRNRWWFVVAVSAWVISFMQQWLFVPFFGCFAALFVSRPLRWWRSWWKECVDQGLLVRIHAIFFVLPFVYYISQRRMFPLSSFFGGYSVPIWNWHKNSADLWRALSYCILTPLARVLHAPAWFWAVTGTSGLTLFICGWYRKPACESTLSGDGSRSSEHRLILAGILLLIVGLLPFVIVGKPFAAEGPQTRFSVLVAPSLAVVAAGVVAGVARIQWAALRRMLCQLGGLLLAAFALQHAQAYADWQACAMKDRAIVAALKKHRPPSDVNFFVVKGSKLEHTYERRHYDWGRILHDAWGGYDRLAVPLDAWQSGQSQDSTPLGLHRNLVANFRRWMGYGNPGPPDKWCVLEIDARPDFDFVRSGVWQAVAADLLHRLQLCAQPRDEWLAGFISRVDISAPREYPFDSELLRSAKFRWEGSATWRPLTTKPIPVKDPLITEFKADPDISGSLSLIPLGVSGFALRCNSVPLSGAPANLSLRISLLASETVPSQVPRAFGVACDYITLNGSTPPSLVLVTLPHREVLGVSRISGDDALEAWAVSPPSHIFLIWRPRVVGEILQVRTLRLGFTQAAEP